LIRSAIGLAVCCLLGLGVEPAFAEVISVDAVLAGKAFSSDKTRTFLWEAKQPAATLVYIPGGDGHLGLRDGQPQLGGFYGTTLRPLSDPRSTSGRLSVVVFDSPTVLNVGARYPTSRAASDHLMRIESVVLHYKERFGRPIWLMGHSNGAVSVTEFYKYLQKSTRESLVSGMVYSAARTGADFSSATTNLPVLFLAHEKDACAAASSSEAKAVYTRLKKVDTAKVEYVAIKGGQSTSENPCSSGYHMYYGAGPEVSAAIDSFIADFYR
jgi:hypothetical protein